LPPTQGFAIEAFSFSAANGDPACFLRSFEEELYAIFETNSGLGF